MIDNKRTLSEVFQNFALRVQLFVLGIQLFVLGIQLFVLGIQLGLHFFHFFQQNGVLKKNQNGIKKGNRRKK